MAKDNFNYIEVETLNQIKSGDTGRYNAESKKNNALKKSYQELGLDTSAIDSWQTRLDAARASAKSNIPKYGNNPHSVLAYEDLENAKKIARDALKNVSDAMDSINESYANRGIKPNALYTEKKQYLKNAFLDEIERLSKTYGMKSVSRNYGKQFYSQYKEIADRIFG